MTTPDGEMPDELSKLEKGYELIGELSRDEMVTVYVARDRLSGNEVAIKVLRASDGRGREALAHYASDARLLTALEHPNIVAVHGVKWLSEDVVAVITERVKGTSLRQVLDVAGTLPVARATEVLKGMARALAWAHSSQIMHRDVRPENVLFEDGTGRVVLSDFGLARRLQPVPTDTSADAYRAPELADGRYPDQRTDVYSLGVVGWELLTGRRPWPDAMDMIQPGQPAPAPPPLAAVRPGLPPVLVSAIEGAVELDRDRRITDVVAFLDRLTGVTPPPRAKPRKDEDDALVVEPSQWVALPVPNLPPRPTAAGARGEPPESVHDREVDAKATRESAREEVRETQPATERESIREVGRGTDREVALGASAAAGPERALESDREAAPPKATSRTEREVQLAPARDVAPSATPAAPAARPAEGRTIRESEAAAVLGAAGPSLRPAPSASGESKRRKGTKQDAAADVAPAEGITQSPAAATSGDAIQRPHAGAQVAPIARPHAAPPGPPRAEPSSTGPTSRDRPVTEPISSTPTGSTATARAGAQPPAESARAASRPAPRPAARSGQAPPEAPRPGRERTTPEHRDRPEDLDRSRPAAGGDSIAAAAGAAALGAVAGAAAAGGAAPPVAGAPGTRGTPSPPRPPSAPGAAGPTETGARGGRAPEVGGHVELGSPSPRTARASVPEVTSRAQPTERAGPPGAPFEARPDVSAEPGADEDFHSPLSGPVSGPVRANPFGPLLGGPLGGPTRRAEGMRGGLGMPRAGRGEAQGGDPSQAQAWPAALDPVFDTPAEFPLPPMPDPRPMPAGVGGSVAERRSRWTRRGIGIGAVVLALIAGAIALARMQQGPDSTADLMRPETPAGYGGDVDVSSPAGDSAGRRALDSVPGANVAPGGGVGGARRTGAAGSARSGGSGSGGAAGRSAPAPTPGSVAGGGTPATRPATPPTTRSSGRTAARTPATPAPTTSAATAPSSVAARPAPARTGTTTSGAARTAGSGTPSPAVAPARTWDERAEGFARCNSPALADQRACISAHLARSDAGLNQIYQDVIAAMRRRASTAPGDPDPPEVQRLRAVQRNWIGRRDAECRRRGRGREGPLWATPRAQCIEELSVARSKELSNTLARLRRD